MSLGSNIDPERYLLRAVERMAGLGKLVGVSSVYQSPAVGGDPQPDFLNAAVLLEVAESAPELRQRLRAVERELGRVRTADKFAPRTIDLDLVWLGDRGERAASPADPQILEQAYLAVPLAEIAPEGRHPLTGESLQAIARRLAPEARLKLRADVTERLLAVMHRRSGPAPDGVD